MSKITSVYYCFLSLDLRMCFVKYQILWRRALKLIRGKIRKRIQIFLYDLFHDADNISDHTTWSVQKTVVMEELDIFAVKTSLSDQFHILECTED
jgi:hypothetical protein